MKVSVIIPVYNEEKIINNCLESLMKQEERPDEIIVVDNNSTDNTISIVKKFKEVKVIKEKRQGIIHARNAGFIAANGDILTRCDADTILPADWIKKIKKDFAQNEKIVAVTQPFVYFDMFLINKSLIPFYTYNFFSKLIIKTSPLLGPSMAIRKIVWNKVKNEICSDDNRVHEDIDLTLHILKYGSIYLDRSIVIKTSSRRIKFNPLSFFIEYQLRLIRMLRSHRHLF